MRLPELDAAQDPKRWEGGSTALHAVQVARDVEQPVSGAHVLGEVRMVRECDRGQAEGQRLAAALLHLAARRVPGPLGVDVAVGNQHSDRELTLVEEMSDYGRPIRFGFFLTPTAHPTQPVELAQLADELGLDYLGIQDHPYQRRFHDTWMLMAA